MWALHSDCTPAEIVAFLVDMWPEKKKKKSSDDSDAETCLFIEIQKELSYHFPVD